MHALHRLFLAQKQQGDPDIASKDTWPFGFKKSISHRNSVMEIKITDFVSTISRTIKNNHCSKLLQKKSVKGTCSVIVSKVLGSYFDSSQSFSYSDGPVNADVFPAETGARLNGSSLSKVRGL